MRWFGHQRRQPAGGQEGRSVELVRDVLLALLRDDDGDLPPGVTDADWVSVLSEARRHRCVGLVSDALRVRNLRDRLPDAVRACVDSSARSAALRLLRLNASLGPILDAFAAARIPVIPLKGAALATRVYRDPALRHMADVDLLVKAGQISMAGAVMEALGYAPLENFRTDVALAVAHHLPPYVKDGAFPVEVHWTLTSGRKAACLNLDALWARAVPCQMLGRQALSLCDEDLVLHLCLHAANHLFGLGLRSLCDIRRMLDGSRALDWLVIVQRAREWQSERAVYLTLRLARDLLAAPVPDRVLNELRPDGVSPILLESARQQVFADPAILRLLTGEISRLAGRQSLASLLKHVGARLFVERVQLAATSDESPEMSRARQAALYVARLGYLVRRYWRPALLMMGFDRPLADLASRQHQLREWLA